MTVGYLFFPFRFSNLSVFIWTPHDNVICVNLFHLTLFRTRLGNWNFNFIDPVKYFDAGTSSGSIESGIRNDDVAIDASTQRAWQRYCHVAVRESCHGWSKKLRSWFYKLYKIGLGKWGYFWLCRDYNFEIHQTGRIFLASKCHY